MLHWALLLFLLESYVYWIMLKTAFDGGDIYWVGFWLWSFMFSFIHIFLVIMDGWSRYQDYKKAKDLFYLYGFKPRIAEWYIGSMCQRNAALQAARELGMEEEVRQHYKDRGVKWFHYIPYFMVRDPMFLIRRTFWERTFLEKYYAPKFNFREIQLEGAG